MAVVPPVMDAILEGLRRAREGMEPAAPLRVMFLGYQHVLLPDAYYRDRLGADPSAFADTLDLAAVRRVHHVNATGVDHVPTLDTLAGVLGSRLGVEVAWDALDVIRHHGSERLADLNEPLPPELAGRYDLVVDGGTLEHVFDIAQGLRNVATLVRPGGCVVHHSPAGMGNHGFYNLNPTLFLDFYGDNGFTVHAVTLLVRDGRGVLEPAGIPATGRFPVPPESCVLALAQKVAAVETLRNPIQGSYKRKPARRHGEETP